MSFVFFVSTLLAGCICVDGWTLHFQDRDYNATISSGTIAFDVAVPKKTSPSCPIVSVGFVVDMLAESDYLKEKLIAAGGALRLKLEERGFTGSRVGALHLTNFLEGKGQVSPLFSLDEPLGMKMTAEEKSFLVVFVLNDADATTGVDFPGGPLGTVIPKSPRPAFTLPVGVVPTDAATATIDAVKEEIAQMNGMTSNPAITISLPGLATSKGVHALIAAIEKMMPNPCPERHVSPSPPPTTPAPTTPAPTTAEPTTLPTTAQETGGVAALDCDNPPASVSNTCFTNLANSASVNNMKACCERCKAASGCIGYTLRTVGSVTRCYLGSNASTFGSKQRAPSTLESCSTVVL